MDHEQKQQALEDALSALKNGVDRMINAAELIEIAAHYIEKSGSVGLSYALKGHASRVVSAGWMLKSIGNAIGAELLAVTPVKEEFTYENNNGDQVSVTSARERVTQDLKRTRDELATGGLPSEVAQKAIDLIDTALKVRAAQDAAEGRSQEKSAEPCGHRFGSKSCMRSPRHDGPHNSLSGTTWPNDNDAYANQEGRSAKPCAGCGQPLHFHETTLSLVCLNTRSRCARERDDQNTYPQEGRSDPCEHRGCGRPAIATRPLGLTTEGPQETARACALHNATTFFEREGRS